MSAISATTLVSTVHTTLSSAVSIAMPLCSESTTIPQWSADAKTAITIPWRLPLQLRCVKPVIRLALLAPWFLLTVSLAILSFFANYWTILVHVYMVMLMLQAFANSAIIPAKLVLVFCPLNVSVVIWPFVLPLGPVVHVDLALTIMDFKNNVSLVILIVFNV